MDEKRKYPRIKTEDLITIEDIGGNEVGKLSAVYDISEAGLRIITPQKLQVAAQLNIKIKIRAKEALVDLKAKVIWSKGIEGKSDKFHAGVEFADISVENRRILKEFIEEHFKSAD